MYKLPIKVLVGEALVQPNFVCKLGEQPLSIPFDPDNTDYQQFKVDVEAGAELLDAEGNVMDTEQKQTFLNSLI